MRRRDKYVADGRNDRARYLRPYEIRALQRAVGRARGDAPEWVLRRREAIRKWRESII